MKSKFKANCKTENRRKAKREKKRKEKRQNQRVNDISLPLTSMFCKRYPKCSSQNRQIVVNRSFAMERLLSSSFVLLLALQCALSMVIPEEKNKREAPESEEVEMVAGNDLLLSTALTVYTLYRKHGIAGQKHDGRTKSRRRGLSGLFRQPF